MSLLWRKQVTILSSAIVGWEYWNDEDGKRYTETIDEDLIMGEIQEPEK